MKKEIKHITVLGDGGWGTTLAIHLSKQGYAVTLWGAFPSYIAHIKKTLTNPKFLPEIKIPKNVHITDHLSQAVNQAQLIVLAIPSQFLKNVLKQIQRHELTDKIFISATKGFDTADLKRMSEIIHGILGNVPLAILSGPTIAKEVALGIPSAAVIACPNIHLAKKLQKIFNSAHFRIYTNSDTIGVEVGGSVKNIIAIACGVCEGLGLGTNTQAAIVTRGLAEMTRLGKALGAKEKTLFGLTGLGDLTTTCFSRESRNRQLGELLGHGQNLKQILLSRQTVSEGVTTAKAIYQLSQQLNIAMPITHEVYKILYKNKKPRLALKDLMNRQSKSEY
jgi:glycerol-3-phosphate dehydrogenase (NAD(P)+)